MAEPRFCHPQYTLHVRVESDGASVNGSWHLQKLSKQTCTLLLFPNRIGQIYNGNLIRRLLEQTGTLGVQRLRCLCKLQVRRSRCDNMGCTVLWTAFCFSSGLEPLQPCDLKATNRYYGYEVYQSDPMKAILEGISSKCCAIAGHDCPQADWDEPNYSWKLSFHETDLYPSLLWADFPVRVSHSKINVKSMKLFYILNTSLW